MLRVCKISWLAATQVGPQDARLSATRRFAINGRFYKNTLRIKIMECACWIGSLMFHVVQRKKFMQTQSLKSWIVVLAMSALFSGCNGSDASDAPPPVSAAPTPVPIVATVQSTSNPLVARMAISAKPGEQVLVEFGNDSSYGRVTSTALTDASGNASILVAGMQATTVYHLRARTTTSTGSQSSADVTFQTGTLPANLAALQLKIESAPGATPQPGVELVNPIASPTYQPYAVDLQGNIIWYYAWPDFRKPWLVQGIKHLASGNFLLVIGDTDRQPLDTPVDRTTSRIREIDLAGDMVREVTVADLNAKLAATGQNLTLELFHHDVEVLPNGHWLVLANTLRNINGVAILGDVVVEIDQNSNPVFIWNEFDHFNPTVRSMQYPDWTHSNAVVYSPTDGNFLVSIRHLHWVVKVNFRNGAGDGSVLWRLGPGGDFTLRNGTDPIDWQYAQHTPKFAGSTTAGVFNLILMDNGNERVVSADGKLCGTDGAVACYTTVPLFRIDEQGRTVTIISRVTLPPGLYSYFAGSAAVLTNGNLEFDLAGLDSNGIVTGSIIREVTPDPAHAIVWSLTTVGNYAYRTERLSSLYPHVTWQ